jgi:drug/metabolite transporter (DMT)-like permease
MVHVITAILLWSSLGVVIRLSGMDVTSLIFYAALISSLLSGALVVLLDLKRHLSMRTILPLLLLAPVSLINTFTFFYAYKHTSIANAVITHYTAPVFVAFLAPLILRERFTFKTLVSALIAMAGLWIMLGFSPQEFIDALIRKDQNSLAIASGLLSGIAYAFVVIIIRAFSPNYHPLIMTFVQNGLITAGLFLLLLPPMPFKMNLEGINIYAILIMGIVHSTIAPVLYFHGMKSVTAQRGALIGYLEPVFSIILGVLFLKEIIDLKTVIGGALVLFSGYMTIKRS